jgi:hypothetical protein
MMLDEIFSSILPSAMGMFFQIVLIVFLSFLLVFNPLMWIRGKFTKKSVRAGNENGSIIIVIVLIAITTLFFYYIIEKYLLYHFVDTNFFEIYDKGTSVVIALIGVTVTAIFSLLLYRATKQGLKTADQLKKIEENRRKEELTEKFLNSKQVPHLHLLEAFDRLLMVLDNFINTTNNIEFADTLSNGSFVDEIESIRNSYEENFIVRLYLNEFLLKFYTELRKLQKPNEVSETDEEYYHNLNIAEGIKEIAMPMRLKALFIGTDENYKNEILEKIGIFEIMLKLEAARMTLIEEIKDEIDIVYGKLLNKEDMKIINSPRLSMKYIWSVTSAPETIVRCKNRRPRYGRQYSSVRKTKSRRS